MTANASAGYRLVRRGLALWLSCTALLRAEETAAVAAPDLPSATAAAEVPPAVVAALVTTEPASPLDLGTLYAGETREVRLKVLNRTDKPITLARVRATCPCTVPRAVSPDPIPAGGAAEVGFQLLGGRLRDGVFRRSIVIDLEGAPQRFVAIEFHGTRAQTAIITPGRDLRLPAGLDPNETWEKTFQVVGNLPEQRLRLDKPVTGRRLMAELNETSPSHYDVKVRSVPALFRGRIEEEISLPVLEPANYAPLRIRIQGQMGATLRVVPRLLQLRRPADATASLTTTVTVYAASVRPGRGPGRTDHQAVDPKELKIVVPEGVVATPTVAEGRTVITLSIPPAVLKLPRIEVGLETTCCGTGAAMFVVDDASAADGTDAAVEPTEDEPPATAAPEAEKPAPSAP